MSNKIKTLEEMERLVLGRPKQTLALVAANSEEALMAVEEAREKGCVDVHLVGDAALIRKISAENGIDLTQYTMTDVKDPREAAACAVSLVREGKAQLLMKGLIETSDFLRAVMDKEKGLRTNARMCALVVIESAAAKKLLVLGDVGTNIAPNVEEKASILESSFLVARAMGIENPKAAVLCANEHVKDSMPCTAEATTYFQEHGVLFGPAKAANAGGVATSGLEMSQNSMRSSWSFDQVDERLKGIMLNIFHMADEAAKECDRPGDLVTGANVAGFAKVANAMLSEGLY